jgi:hypothetical protein
MCFIKRIRLHLRFIIQLKVNNSSSVIWKVSLPYVVLITLIHSCFSPSAFFITGILFIAYRGRRTRSREVTSVTLLGIRFEHRNCWTRFNRIWHWPVYGSLFGEYGFDLCLSEMGTTLYEAQYGSINFLKTAHYTGNYCAMQFNGRVVSSGMLRCVALVRTDVSRTLTPPSSGW